MAVADSLGHNFEFDPVQDEVSDPSAAGARFLEYPCATQQGGRLHNPSNVFRLKAGQWTDDASMGLCLADSLLTRGGYDGSNLRILFWNWWENGLNNAFRLDMSREGSVGLGGNISKSIDEVRYYGQRGQPPPSRFSADKEDAGNGSIMRLAPAPVWCHTDIKEARDLSFEQSLTTHPGKMAAEACAFMAHIIVRAIHRDVDTLTTAKAFLDDVAAEYLALLEGKEEELGSSPARVQMMRLIRSNEPDGGTERCWNWKSSSLHLCNTVLARGRSYNGYPVSAGYFGAFSMDGLSMALHCLYTTDSLNAAIVKIVNFAGDADTTGSICGQMAGAYYGVDDLEPTWISNMQIWAGREIELRAICLFYKGGVESSSGDNGSISGGSDSSSSSSSSNSTAAVVESEEEQAGGGSAAAATAP